MIKEVSKMGEEKDLGDFAQAVNLCLDTMKEVVSEVVHRILVLETKLEDIQDQLIDMKKGGD